MTHDFLLPLIKTALAEDIGTGDITSELLVPAGAQANLQFVAREKMVVCGGFVPALVYGELDKGVKVYTLVDDGTKVEAGAVIATVSGPARAILTGERTALNMMQRMSGVTSLTFQYVQAVAGTKARILDTRKTMPGMRLVDKYAVRVGGGHNHRIGLYDGVMVKDNHIAGVRIQDSGFRQMIEGLRAKLDVLNPESRIPIPVYVECDRLEQVQEALTAMPDRIMLDNMPLDVMKEAVRLASGSVPLEATGGVNLQNVRAVAETGVDYISIGAITHSARAVDIGLDSI